MTTETETETKVPDAAVRSYLETLLWSETLSERLAISDGRFVGIYEEGASLSEVIDTSDLPPEIWAEARKDLREFAEACLAEGGPEVDPWDEDDWDPREVAKNLALSRNGHGAGFFDSSWVDAGGREQNNALHQAAKSLGTCGLDLWMDPETGLLRVASHG